MVCSVENTRCPVSAAVIAVDIVSRSRISPTSITSGSCRSAALRAAAYESVSFPTSRCATIERRLVCRYSIGSSSVIIFLESLDAMTSIRLANVVDLPLPVAPVTRTSPLIFVVRLTTDCGMPSCCGVGTSYERIRSAAAYEPLCLNTLALTREKPSTEKAKSSSPFFFSTSLSSCGTIGESRLSVSTLVRTWFPCGTSIPSILSITGFPGAICISDEFCCCAAFKMSTICIFFSPLVFKRGL